MVGFAGRMMNVDEGGMMMVMMMMMMMMITKTRIMMRKSTFGRKAC